MYQSNIFEKVLYKTIKYIIMLHLKIYSLLRKQVITKTTIDAIPSKCFANYLIIK